MSDIDAVLFANEAFYVSFASGDVDAMDELWSSQAPISCIHPGWESLSGREDVVESWRSIIRGGAPAIRNVLEGKSAGKVDHRFLARWRVQHNFPSTGAFGTTNRCRADDAAYTRTIKATRFDISRSAKSHGL